jgi:tetratricopeptide (TPR) repeat protein
MRRLLCFGLTLLITANSFAQDGKVPITTSSEEARSLYLQGRTYVERLQAREGRVLFEQALVRDPQFALAEYNLSLAAPTARDAAAHLDRALALANQVSAGERLLILAQQARANADPAKVVQHLEALVAQYPQDERGHWLLGGAYGAGQRYQDAIAQYRKAITINSTFSLAYNSVGYAYRATDSMAAAEQAFQRYIALVPDDPNPYDSYAELLMKLGRFDASIEQYRKALAIDPNFGASHVGIAANHMFAGRYPAAIAEAQVYYDRGRDDRERRIALSSQLYTFVEQGRTDQALGIMEKVHGLARATGDSATMAADAVTIGDILLEAGQVDAARERYQQSHDLVAGSSLPAEVKQDDALSRHYNMGRVALALHDLPTARREAAAYLSGAVERHNDVRVRQAHELIGLLDLHDKKYDASLAEFDQGNDRNPEVLYAVAQIWRGKGDLDLARRLEAEAVNAYILPTLPYAFIRARAKRSPGT